MRRSPMRRFLCPAVAAAVVLSAGFVFADGNRPADQGILSLLQEAKGAAGAITDDPYLRDAALRGVAGAQAEAGRFDDALETASLIADAYLKASAWRQIAVAQARAGDRATSGKLLDKVLEAVGAFKNVPSSRVDALIATAEAQARIGDASGALKTAGLIGDLRGKAEALRAIALVQVKDRDIMGALETAAAIADVRAQAEALRGIAAVRAEAGDREGALQTASAIKDPRLMAGALGKIAVAAAVARDRTGSRDVLKQALDVAMTVPVEGEKADALGGIALAHVEAGDVAGALKTAAMIERVFSTKPLPDAAVTVASEALRAIAVAQARRGDRRGALQTVERIGNPYMQASALAEIAVVQASAGDRMAAGGTLRRATQVASAVREWSAKAPALLAIAQAYARVGDRATAVQTFRQARQAVRASDDERYRDDALMDLAMVQAGSGDFGGAVETADGIRDVFARAHAWRVVAAVQGGSGNRESVRLWLASEGASVKKAYALLGLAEGLLAPSVTAAR